MRRSTLNWYVTATFIALYVIVVTSVILWIITRNATYWWVMLGAYVVGWLLYLPSRWARKAMLDELYK